MQKDPSGSSELVVDLELTVTGAPVGPVGPVGPGKESRGKRFGVGVVASNSLATSSRENATPVVLGMLL